ncbi:MAG: hypothetical protein ACI910_000400 [Oleispira sp.]|jgi:hypothetical protein
MHHFMILLKKVKSFIYKKNELIFYIYAGNDKPQHDKNVELIDRVECVQFTKLKFIDPSTKNNLVDELSKGSFLNVITNFDGYVCHHSCVTEKGVVIGEIDIFFDLISNQIYIYNCQTEITGQRQGLYRAALSEIINSYPGRDIYICSLSWNFASIKCLESLGFSSIFTIDYLKILGIKKYKSDNAEVSKNVIGI